MSINNVYVFLFKKEKRLLFPFYFILPVFIGLEPERRTYKQSKWASLRISNLITMIKTDRKSRMLIDITNQNPKSVAFTNHSATTRSNVSDLICFACFLEEIIYWFVIQYYLALQTVLVGAHLRGISFPRSLVSLEDKLF